MKEKRCFCEKYIKNISFCNKLEHLNDNFLTKYRENKENPDETDFEKSMKKKESYCI